VIVVVVVNRTCAVACRHHGSSYLP